MIWTAFTIGLLGSLHCVGMCGPIALALPYGQSQKEQPSKWSRLWKVLLYNFGRITTYVVLGAFIGLVSQGLLMAEIQRWVSVGLGVFLIVIAIFAINIESKLLRASWISRFYLYLKMQLQGFMRNSRAASFYKVGLLNGFLPCGLVYMAILGALTAGNFTDSIMYMVLFGLGTMPLMAATALLGQVMSLKVRRSLQRVYPVFMIGFAALLIMRGLNLEIPLTLDVFLMTKEIPTCH